MTRIELSDYFNRIETKYEVDTLKVKAMHIWPIVKQTLAHIYFQSNNRRDSKKRNKHKFVIIRDSVIGLFRFFQYSILTRLFFQKTDLLFVCSGAHRELKDGSWVNKYLSLFINDTNKKSFTYIEWSNKLQFPGQTIHDKVIRNIYMVKNTVPIFRKFIKKPQIENIKLLDKIIEDYCSKVNFEASEASVLNKIMKKLENVAVHSIMYKRILSVCQPQTVILVNSYKSSSYALSYLCSSKSIPTVDVQHGGQGALNFAYSGYTSCPDTGYNSMTKYFWVWDSSSALEIKKWVDNQSYHQVIIGGNPWLTYVSQFQPQKVIKDTIRILVTLQFESINENLYAAIKKSDQQYQWFVRAHPRKKESISTLSNRIEEDKLQNVDLYYSNNEWLPTLIQQCDVHISEYSGSVIEANILGKHSIIISKIGREIYSDYIENGEAFYCEHEDSILSSIETVMQMDPLESKVLPKSQVESLFNSIT